MCYALLNYIQTWGYDREGDLFFFILRFLFDFFPNHLKPIRVSSMPSITYKTVKIQREEKQKNYDFGPNFFSYLDFKISGNFVRISRFQ